MDMTRGPDVVKIRKCQFAHGLLKPWRCQARANSFKSPDNLFCDEKCSVSGKIAIV